MGQATAPRVQALISNDDDAWIKKNKPKGMTTSKFVASLVAEAIVDKERRRKIGAGTNDAIHNLVIECASCLEELQNLCQYFNRKLKDDIKHHLDGTQFQDRLLYNAFVLSTSVPEAHKTITGAIETYKEEGLIPEVKDTKEPSDGQEFDELMERISALTHFVMVKKLELEEGIVDDGSEDGIKQMLDECNNRLLPECIAKKVIFMTQLAEAEDYMSSLRTLIKLLENCQVLLKEIQTKA